MINYINSLSEGMHVNDVYLCKAYSILLNKNGKEYGNLVMQDKTGTIEAKIWNLGPAIENVTAPAYVYIDADVTSFNGANQLSIRRLRTASENEYIKADYLPSTERDIAEMEQELLAFTDSVKDEHLHQLLRYYFGNRQVMRDFLDHSAAKSVHHAFVGGLAEHTLSVTAMCDKAAEHYPYLNRDLLITGALLHDIGKIRELSLYPENDYTDEGQLLGHITIGAQMVSDTIAKMPDFPKVTRSQLLHLILSHHGEYEFGSPKKPAIMEAFVLSFMDNMDAKVETLRELIDSKAPVNKDGWLGYSKLLDSNVRKTM